MTDEYPTDRQIKDDIAEFSHPASPLYPYIRVGTVSPHPDFFNTVRALANKHFPSYMTEGASGWEAIASGHRTYILNDAGAYLRVRDDLGDDRLGVDPGDGWYAAQRRTVEANFAKGKRQ